MVRSTFLSAFAAMMLLVFTAPASAQQTAPPPPQTQELPDIEVDDQELRTIAEAYVEVQNITTTYRERLNAADDAETAREIQQEYAQVANQAIQEEGVEIERYDTVIRVAQADEELGERLLTEIQTIVEDEQSPPNQNN